MGASECPASGNSLHPPARRAREPHTEAADRKRQSRPHEEHSADARQTGDQLSRPSRELTRVAEPDPAACSLAETLTFIGLPLTDRAGARVERELRSREGVP